MKIFFALLLIILLTFSGYHLSFRRFKLPVFARTFYLTGTEFLFLGLLLGSQFMNILDVETLQDLSPLNALVLGWIGLLFGFQFEVRKLRRFPFEFVLAAVLESLITFVLVFLGSIILLSGLSGYPDAVNVIIALTLASAAACTAQTGLALQTPGRIDQNRETIRLLRFISSVDGLSAILIFGLVFILRPAITPEASGWEAPLLKILTSMGISIGLVLLYMLLISLRRQSDELSLIVIGMVVLTCGTASVLHLSPLLTSFVVGVCMANLSREKERIFNLLISVEKPVYLLLLVFLGAGWQLDNVLLLIPAAVYCLFRMTGKLLSGIIVQRLNPRSTIFSSRMGLGLLGQGGLPLAVLLEFQQEFPFDFTPMVITLGLIAVLYNDVLSPYFLNKLLDEGKA